MIKQENLNTIEKITQEFFEKMSFQPEITVKSLSDDKTVSIELKIEEPQVLIGERGQTLSEIQHLLKAILRRNITDEFFYINLDVNDYKKKKTEYLKEIAGSIADEVALSKKERVLEPMPAYERRIIHLEIAGRENVTSESLGQEPDRRVVIRPYP